MVDQVLFHADVPGKHVRDESIRKFVLGVQHANHFVLINHQHGGRRRARRRPHTDRLARETSFAKEISRLQNGNHGFFACGIDDGKLYRALLDIHHVLGRIALGKDGRSFGETHNFPRHTGRVEESLGVKGSFLGFPVSSWRC